jgi:methyl-accepting chemotaxis protein
VTSGHAKVGIKVNKSRKVSFLVWTGFGVVFLIVALVAAVSWHSTNAVKDDIDWVNHTLAVELRATEFEKMLVDAETAQRGFLYTRREAYLEPYLDAEQAYQKQLSDLRERVGDNPAQVARVDELTELAEQKFAELQQTIDLQRSGRAEEAYALIVSDQGKQLMDQVRVVVRDFIDIEEGLLDVRIKQMERALSLTRQLAVFGAIAVIAVGVFVSFFVTSGLMRPIRSVVSDLSTSLQQMTAAAEAQQRHAAQQATAATETTTTMEELDRSARANAEKAESMRVAAGETLELTKDGVAQLERAQESSSALHENVERIAEQVGRLNSHADKIEGITVDVAEIATRTNLLAINAAVEAARASRGSEGFAVIADEIRKMADESKVSAARIQSLLGDIHQLINTTAEATQRGSAEAAQVALIAEQNAGALAQIANASAMTTTSTEQIALNSKEQATAVHQVVAAMMTLDAGAEEAAAAMSQQADALRSVERSAQRLGAMV